MPARALILRWRASSRVSMLIDSRGDITIPALIILFFSFCLLFAQTETYFLLPYFLPSSSPSPPTCHAFLFYASSYYTLLAYAFAHAFTLPFIQLVILCRYSPQTDTAVQPPLTLVYITTLMLAMSRGIVRASCPSRRHRTLLHASRTITLVTICSRY